MYERFLPSLSLILGDVIGGPPGDPHALGGGGWIAWYDNANNPTNKTTESFVRIPERKKETKMLNKILFQKNQNIMRKNIVENLFILGGRGVGNVQKAQERKPTHSRTNK